MRESYEQAVVVVTGASAGIGAALAEELSRRGARVVLVARRRSLLEEVAARCTASSLVVDADVTVRSDVDRVLASTLRAFGRVDVWVNCAGRGISREWQQLTDDDVDAMVRDNVMSVLYAMQAVVPVLQEQGEGVVANVSSFLGLVPRATFRSAYSAAKAAVNSLTDTVRFSLADHPGIRVVLVIPGVVATEFGTNALGGGVDSRTLPGTQTAEDVARIVADGLLAGPLDLYTRPEGVGPALDHLRALAGE